jgi:hypothetical protein
MSRHRSSRAFTAVTVVLLACAAACSAASGDEDPARAGETACPATIGDWKPDTWVTAGSFARYGGATYRCVQSHTTLSVWPPDIVPALWEKVTCSSGGGGTDAGVDGGGGAVDTGTGTGGKDTGTTPKDTGTTPKDTGGAVDTGTGGVDTGGGGTSHTEYAPYFYTWGWGNTAYPFTGLADLKAKSGLSAVTLAFVLGNGGCSATRDIQDHLADVKAFVAGGGHVKASFGGADGTYLEASCSDDASMASAIEKFVDETGITDLDFDVEQGGVMDSTSNARRSKALKRVQGSRGIQVAFTLAAFPRDKWGTPGGITAASVDVVKAAVAAGVRISHVNLMTMDYGGYYSTGYAMGDLAVSAVTDAAAQLKAIIPGLTDAQAFAMLGATPMIGRNDVSSETFTLTDARTLIAFARDKKLGLVSFWAINRDQPGSSLALSSLVNTRNFEFHDIFKTAL